MVFDRDKYRANLNKYTRQAFRLLPPLEKPRLLDIGCGTGVDTLELARISSAEIVALDSDSEALDRLADKAAVAGVSDRISICRCSMTEMDFSPESFDIIWAEGSIAFVGFANGIRNWRMLLKPHGYLGVHDEVDDLDDKLELVTECGYRLLGHFELASDVWWKEYLAPMARRIAELKDLDGLNNSQVAAIQRAEREIDEYRKTPSRFRSVFLVMQRV
jgi:ubiquinone/menaquinone biosynthesis C-methylase UbiE